MRSFCFFALILMLSTVAFANNDPMYFFTFNMGGNAGSALLSTTDLGGGQFLVTGGTLDVTAGADVGIYPVIGGGPALFSSPSGAFVADNLLFPATNPILDGAGGLLFGNGSLEVNLWANGPDNYSFWSHDGSGYNVEYIGGGAASASPTPEPSTLLTLGSGLIGLAGLARKRLFN